MTSGELKPNVQPPPASLRDGGPGGPSPDGKAWSRFGIAVSALSLAFFGPLATLLKLALASDLHSHVLLVPWVAGYLVWIERRRLPTAGPPAVGATVLLGIAAAGCVAAGWLPGAALPADLRLSLRIMALVLGVAGCGSALLGRDIFRSCAFAFAFLGFLVPLPDGVVNLCETALQHASAEAASWAFDAAGMPVIRDGLVFRLPGMTIKVAQECSGFRSTLVLFIVSVLAARMFLLSTWKRAVLVAAIFPLGILRNALRIWVIATLSVDVDPDILNSWLHHRGGPLFFVVSLIPLYLLLWSLHRSERRSPQASDPRNSPPLT